MKYTLAITDKDLSISHLYFEELDDARAALKEKVRDPINEYIKDFDSTHTLVIQKLGKKKRLYTHELPYSITQGSDYCALVIRDNSEYVLGGVIAETAKIDRILADNSSYANAAFPDEEEN